MHDMSFLRGLTVVLIGACASAVCTSQGYPAKPVRIFASEAGGGGDFLLRLVSQGLAASLGEAQRNRSPDAARRARDQRGQALQFEIHDGLFRLSTGYGLYQYGVCFLNTCLGIIPYTT